MPRSPQSTATLAEAAPGRSTRAPPDLRLLEERARQRGRADGRLGLTTHAELYPPGAYGHGDYWLGQQQIENERFQRQVAAEERRAASLVKRRAAQKARRLAKLKGPNFKRPSQAQRRAGLALGHPKP